MPTPIFVFGTGRSGTTVVARILSEHSQVCGLKWESQFLVSRKGLLDLAFLDRKADFDEALSQFESRLVGPWFQRTMRAGTPSEYKAGLFCDIAFGDVQRALRFLESQHQKALSKKGSLPKGFVPGFVNVLLQNTVRESQSFWLEKTPSSLIQLDRLYNAFPNAKFVHVTRDWRDVCASLIRRKFWPIAPHPRFPETRRWGGDVSLEKASDYIDTCLSIGEHHSKTIPAQQFFTLRLEDLTLNPNATLEAILSFLGLPYESLLDQLDADKANIGVHKVQLCRHDIQWVSNRLREPLMKYGYVSH
jgi:hypothetical protein